MSFMRIQQPLVSFDAGCMQIGDDVLAHLARCKSLRYVNITATCVTGAGLRALRGCQLYALFAESLYSTDLMDVLEAIASSYGHIKILCVSGLPLQNVVPTVFAYNDDIDEDGGGVVVEGATTMTTENTEYYVNNYREAKFRMMEGALKLSPSLDYLQMENCNGVDDDIRGSFTGIKECYFRN
tara:strand:+ start:837 stop:1385 length:549 start_codon:yes stop_codon:yes gene_type:complete